MRGQVPFANGPYDRYENGYSRGMNGPSAPGGGGPPSYHDQPAYERYSCDRYFTQISNIFLSCAIKKYWTGWGWAGIYIKGENRFYGQVLNDMT